MKLYRRFWFRIKNLWQLAEKTFVDLNIFASSRVKVCESSRRNNLGEFKNAKCFEVSERIISRNSKWKSFATWKFLKVRGEELLASWKWRSFVIGKFRNFTKKSWNKLSLRDKVQIPRLFDVARKKVSAAATFRRRSLSHSYLFSKFAIFRHDNFLREKFGTDKIWIINQYVTNFLLHSRTSREKLYRTENFCVGEVWRLRISAVRKVWKVSKMSPMQSLTVKVSVTENSLQSEKFQLTKKFLKFWKLATKSFNQAIIISKFDEKSFNRLRTSALEKFEVWARIISIDQEFLCRGSFESFDKTKNFCVGDFEVRRWKSLET